MSADVTPLREHVERWAPDPAIIADCERMLELAKSGKLRAVGFALVQADNLTEGGRASFGFTVTGNVVFAMSHAIRMLSKRWDDYCDPPKPPSPPAPS